MDKRKTGIIVACVLGIAVLLYLSGLLGQLLCEYDIWQNRGGFTGKVSMGAIYFSPFCCVPYAFSAYGLRSLAILTGAIVLVIGYIWAHNRFGNGEYDMRNFKRSKQGSYGTAGWMEPKEMKDVLEVTSPGSAQGTILGSLNGSVVCVPEETYLNKHLAVFGASGTGKSRAIIRNYLFQAIKRGESVVLTDSKTELYTDFFEYFKANDYTIRVYNLVDTLHSDSWNSMADLAGDTMLAQLLTDVIIANTSGEGRDRFWDSGEANLLKALVLYIDRNEGLSLDEKNLPAVYALLTQYSEHDRNALFDRLDISHPAKAPYNLFRQASDTVRAGIVLGLGIRLQILQNEAVKRITSCSDIDLTLPGKQKCAYFVILSDQEDTLDCLSSLFFSFLFIKLVRFADSSPGGQCPIPVNLVLDEFNNIGTLCGADGSAFSRKLSTIRSRSIRVVYAVQNLSQLRNRYPDDIWAELLGNTDIQLMLGCTDELTAKFASDRSGDMTIEVNSTMTVRKTIAVAQLIPQYRYNESLGRRKLLTPDEVMRIPNSEMLVIIRGQKLLKLEKFDFSKHPDAKKLKPSSVSDYQPQPHEDPVIVQPASPKPSQKPKPRQRKSGLYEIGKPDEF